MTWYLVKHRENFTSYLLCSTDYIWSTRIKLKQTPFSSFGDEPRGWSDRQDLSTSCTSYTVCITMLNI